MSRLKERYLKDIVPELIKAFGYSNAMAVPKLEKIVVNMGLGEATANVKVLDATNIFPDLIMISALYSYLP